MKSTGYNSKMSWISMVAVAVIGLIVSLPMRLLGLFYVFILDNYKVTRDEALIPIVTYGTLRTLSGPIVGYLGQTWGLRAIIVTGCLLASLGIGLSCLTEDIISLTICLGFIYGTGLSLSNNLISSVIRQNFTEYLSLTSGIYITASSIGSAVMTPVINYLTNEYGTSGMFLILCGIFLHTVPAALFLKNPKNEELEHPKNLSEKQIKNNNQENKLDKSESFTSVSKEEKRDEVILQVIPTIKCGNVISEKNISLSDNYKKSYVNEAFQMKSENFGLNESNGKREISVISGICHATDEELKNGGNQINVKLLKYSETEIDESKNTLASVNYGKTNSDDLVKEHCEPQVTESALNKKKSNSFCESFRLLYDPRFLLQMSIQSGYCFGGTLAFSVMIDYSRDKKLSMEEGLYFLTFTPIAQIFGSLCFNWITDSGYMTRSNFCAICFSILSLDILVLIFFSNFTILMIAYLLFGLINGALFSIFPGMIMDGITEKKEQNMALASRFTLYGLMCPLKSPVVGYFRGQLESYDGIFYAFFVISVLCIVLAKLTPFLEKKFKKSKSEIRR